MVLLLHISISNLCTVCSQPPHHQKLASNKQRLLHHHLLQHILYPSHPTYTLLRLLITSLLEEYLQILIQMAPFLPLNPPHHTDLKSLQLVLPVNVVCRQRKNGYGYILNRGLRLLQQFLQAEVSFIKLADENC